MRVYVESYGCAQNRGEGAAIARSLAERGHALVPEPTGADVGILVTCAVVGPTEWRMVRRWRALTQRVPRVVVTGCLVPLRSGVLTGPGRERTELLPIREQASLSELLDGGPSAAVRDRPAATEPPLPPPPRPGVTEEVVIAQGCTSGCSYCFSRLARGRLESVPPETVVDRVRSAVARGAVEVRLTSLDTSAWGCDRGEGERLPELLAKVREAAGPARVRVGMMSPQTLLPILGRTLDALAPETFYRFLHLPVQSGADAVLDRMRRGYGVDAFRRAVATARARYPDLMLATDVLVGFPGESDDDHRATEALIAEVAPESVNVTRFSPRPGTPAAHLPPLPSRVAKARSRSLTELRRRVARRRLERWIGREERGRVVEHGPRGSSVARLANYLPVVLGASIPLGSSVDLRIDGARTTYLLGSVRHASF